MPAATPGRPVASTAALADCGRFFFLASVFTPLKPNSSGALKSGSGFLVDPCCVLVIDWALVTLDCSALPPCVRHTRPTSAAHLQQFVF